MLGHREYRFERHPAPGVSVQISENFRWQRNIKYYSNIEYLNSFDL